MWELVLEKNPQKYYKNEPRFNSVFSRNNLSKKIEDGAYIINPDEYENVGTHCIALFCKNNEIVYFDSLVLNIFLKKLKNLLKNFLEIKIKKLTFFEYKKTIQSRVDTFA